MNSQLKFDGIPSPEPHANRGRAFESMLERTHDFYGRQRIGKVEKIPNAWAYCNEAEYFRLPDDMKAVTGTGRLMKRIKTSCDYLGTVSGRGVAFDAKEFAGSSIPFSQFTAHQVRRLYEYARVKTLAGFMILAKRIDSVFWIDAEALSTAFHIGIGRPKSFNIDWLKTYAVLICERASQVTIDWARVLIPQPSLP